MIRPLWDRRRVRRPVAWGAAAIVAGLLASPSPSPAQPARGPSPEQPASAPSPEQPVRAARQMVAAANPMAARAALDALDDGGSAVDAAIAAQLVLAVVEPQASGLAGGGLMLLWDAATRRLEGWEGLSAAPADSPAALNRAEDGSRIPAEALDRSGRAVGIPGVMPMLALAHDRHGRLPWARLVRDAVRLATSGFPLPPYLHAVLARQPGLARAPGFAAYFDAAGQPLPAGTLLRNPPLADTLRRLGEEGPQVLATGPLAAAVIGAVRDGPHPGRMTTADLLAYRARERPPVCVEAFAHRLCSAAPPSSGGIAVLQEMAMLERAGIARTAPGSVEAAHLILQAARLAAADRRRWLGDPDQVVVPVRGLLDPGYLDTRAALIRPGPATPNASNPNASTPNASTGDAPAGDPPGRQGAIPPASEAFAQPATTHVAIMDAAGSALSFTTTVNLDFGAWRLAGGMVLNDALTNFARPPGANASRATPGGGIPGLSALVGPPAANALAPRKRPVSTMAPTLVFDAAGRPVLAVGAGGGARIIDAVVQVLLGVLAWHDDVRAAIEQPRIGAQNRAEELEYGTTAAALAAPLARLGDHPVTVPMNAGVQAVAQGPDGLEGWGDAHRDGVALGD